MLRRGDSEAAGARLNSKVGLLLLALVVGSSVPVAAAVYVGSRSPVPPGCHGGTPTPVHVSGSLVFSRGAALYFTPNGVDEPRLLVDFNPPPKRITAGPSASPSASPPPAPSPSPSGSPEPSPSPSPPPPATRILAAAVSDDRQLVAVLLADPPDEPGMVSLRVLSPFDPPGTNPAEGWSAPSPSSARGRGEVQMLAGGNVLFKAPAKVDPPSPSTRLVGVVAAAAGSPKLIRGATEDQYDGSQAATWPETKDLKPAPSAPRLDARIIAPSGTRVVGLTDTDVRTPLIHRVLHELRAGTAGSRTTRLLCAGSEDLTPVAFSPDANSVAVASPEVTYLLDLGGGHGLSRILDGRLLDWRP